MRPGWRSALFVAADDSRRLAGVATRGADLVILDLEDAVAPASKHGARAGVAHHCQTLVEAGQQVAVRINSGWLDALADIAAAVAGPVSALVVPKVEDPAALAILAAILREHEERGGIAPGTIGLIALIETPLALARLDDIAGVAGVIGLALGSEDFSLAMGAAPTSDVLDLPCRQIAIAAAARGLMALALPISIAQFTDMVPYRAAIALARAVGATGSLCIHPAQVAALNAGFAPGPAELAQAKAILQAWAERGDAAVIRHDGRMIDLPVVLRAQALLGTIADQGPFTPSENRQWP